MKKRAPRARRQFIVGAILAIVIVEAVIHLPAYFSGKPDAAKPPAPSVVVQTLAPQQVRVWSEFSGRLQAVNAAEIRPEVSGRITELRFEDGQEVKAGQVLFVIDPRPYEAAVAKAQAALATAQTNAKFAALEEHRAAGMMKSQAIARSLYDARANSSHVAVASIQSAKAELEKAQLDLEHAYVRAPIKGQVGRAELTVGNVVDAGVNAPLLTTVVANRSVYADFEVDEQTYMQQVRARGGRAQDHAIPVELVVKGDNDHSYKGTIYSFDNRIDVGSGTIRARAKFANTDGALIPGMFVTVKLASGDENGVLLVPERAISFDQDKKFVYTVDADNKVVYREVELDKTVEGGRIVLKGVDVGDRVIVDGVQQVRPGATVTPKELGAEAEAPAAPAAEATPSTDAAKKSAAESDKSTK